MANINPSSPFISLHLFAIFGFWLTDGAQAHASIKTCSEASIKTELRLLWCLFWGSNLYRNEGLWRVMKGGIVPINLRNPDKHRGFQGIDEGWRVLCQFLFKKYVLTRYHTYEQPYPSQWAVLSILMGNVAHKDGQCSLYALGKRAHCVEQDRSPYNIRLKGACTHRQTPFLHHKYKCNLLNSTFLYILGS